MHDFLVQAAVFLAAAAIAAPLGRWLKIGSVLGYLAAGVLIGPYGIGFVVTVYQVDSILHIAEFGVALLLFLIGLELRPARLFSMRKSVFGAGSLQVLVTAAILGGLVFWSGLTPVQAAVLGCALALSSTAFVLQILEEKKELTTRHGRLAFSILLFQDLFAIPLLAIVPLLGASGAATPMDALIGIAKAAGMIALVIFVGRWLLGRLYAFVASTGVREAMTASALLTVVGVALAMDAVGLSIALGAFIAGALLADSEYRHQIEADLAPFEGLLLGLFFTAIGMSLNINLLGEQAPMILGLVLALIAIKAAVLFVVGQIFQLGVKGSRRLSIAGSQGGEFAFVVLALAVTAGLFDKALSDLVTVVVTLSMVVTPFLLVADDWWRRQHVAPLPAFDAMPEESGHVVIAGFGRFGQIVGRVLQAKGIPFTALDVNPDQIAQVRPYGNDAYFGDAARLDILEAANMKDARVFMLAIDDVEASMKTVEVVKQHFPEVPIVARARNRNHAHRLIDAGVRTIRRETFLSALDTTGSVLRELGMPEPEIRRTLDTFAEHDRARLYTAYQHMSDEAKQRSLALAAAEELREILAEDAEKARAEAAE